MSRRLSVAVHLVHPETYEPVILRPGDEPDQAVADLITNPDCWDEDQEVIEVPTMDDPAAVTVVGVGTSAPEPEPEPGQESASVPEPETAKPARRRKAPVKDEEGGTSA